MKTNMSSIRRQQYIPMSWCLKHGIKAYPVAISNAELYVEINDNGKIIKGKTLYNSKGNVKGEENWWDAIFRIYNYLYTKHKDEVHRKETQNNK